jgi:hypothetical protein
MTLTLLLRPLLRRLLALPLRLLRLRLLTVLWRALHLGLRRCRLRGLRSGLRLTLPWRLRAGLPGRLLLGMLSALMTLLRRLCPLGRLLRGRRRWLPLSLSIPVRRPRRSHSQQRLLRHRAGEPGHRSEPDRLLRRA